MRSECTQNHNYMFYKHILFKLFNLLASTK